MARSIIHSRCLQSLGFHSLRVFLHNLLWEHDKEGFLKRFDIFLALADKRGIGITVVPLDGVWDPEPNTSIADGY